VPVKRPSSLIPPLKKIIIIALASGFTPLAVAGSNSDSIAFASDAGCPAPVIELPAVLKSAKKGSLDAQDIGIEGDQMDLDGKSKITMQGNAQIVQGRRGVFADRIVYDQDNYFAKIDGNVRYYSEAGDEVKTNTMELEVDTFIGETGKAEMRLADREKQPRRATVNYLEDYTFMAPFRGRRASEVPEDADTGEPRVGSRVWAEKIELEGEDFQRVHQARLTRCAEGEDVLIQGSEIELDQEEGVGYAKNVIVKFKGIPIMYAPRFSFPLNDERKTGFLAPSFGDDQKSGFLVSTPYYINLAPNYDATLRPTFYSDRGAQLYGEFRHLGDNGDGILRAEFMPSDKLFDDQDRYAYGLDYRQSYSNGWNWLVDLQDVSDTSYLNDFRNDINITSATHLQQRLQLNYSDSLLYMRGTASKYTVSAPNLASSNPYERLPQIAFGIRPQTLGLFELGFDSEVVNYSDDNNGSRVTGTRLGLAPYIEMPINPIYGFVKPKLSFQSISYQLDNTLNGGDDAPSVAVPMFSVDSGLYFERDMNLGGLDMLQTLEPRAMYVYVPAENQDDAPLFDTGEGTVSSYNVLFRERRFFGGDRIGDDNHVSLGLTSRIISDKTGKERFKASIGQLYYLADREVGLNPGDAVDTLDKSDVFAELNALLTNEVDIRSSFRWDQNDGSLTNMSAGVQYESGYRRAVAADYFKNSTSSEDVRFTLDWPLSSRWQFSTGQRYSITDSDFRESSYGLIYDSCCWAVGVSASSILQSDGEYNERFVVSLELDGLGKVSAAQ